MLGHAVGAVGERHCDGCGRDGGNGKELGARSERLGRDSNWDDLLKKDEAAKEQLWAARGVKWTRKRCLGGGGVRQSGRGKRQTEEGNPEIFKRLAEEAGGLAVGEVMVELVRGPGGRFSSTRLGCLGRGTGGVGPLCYGVHHVACSDVCKNEYPLSSAPPCRVPLQRSPTAPENCAIAGVDWRVGPWLVWTHRLLDTTLASAESWFCRRASAGHRIACRKFDVMQGEHFTSLKPPGLYYYQPTPAACFRAPLQLSRLSTGH